MENQIIIIVIYDMHYEFTAKDNKLLLPRNTSIHKSCFNGIPNGYGNIISDNDVSEENNCMNTR